MTELIATLGEGKGSWKHVQEIISKQEWEGIFLVTNPFGAEKFFMEGKKITFIVIDDRKDIFDLERDIFIQLKEHVKGMEVAVNFYSGTGKEHMALLPALLKLGVGMRFIALKNEQIQELGI